MTDRISIPDYISGLTLDQCNRIIEVAGERILTLKGKGRVDVWTVSVHTVVFATLDQKAAIAWMAEALRLVVEQGKSLPAFSVESSWEWRADVEGMIAEHAKSTPAKFVQSLSTS